LRVIGKQTSFVVKNKRSLFCPHKRLSQLKIFAFLSLDKARKIQANFLGLAPR
jgi:hypothetical protein